MSGITGFLVYSGSLGVSLGIPMLIAVPVTGVIVRLRANYCPKSPIQLGGDGDYRVYSGPVDPSFMDVFDRVYRIEGLGGLYKGLMPIIISALLWNLFAGSLRIIGWIVNLGQIAAWSLVAFSFIVGIPASIITYRAMVTPYKLPWFDPTYSLRMLLTPTERHRPWVLYLTPSLLPVQILNIVLLVGIDRALERLLVGVAEVLFFGLTFTVYIVLVMVLSALVTCPLEVMTAKLAVQRNHWDAEYEPLGQGLPGNGRGERSETYSDEDVIGFRSEQDPYVNVFDCISRIIIEEGWKTFFRGWWISLLVAMVGAIMIVFRYAIG